MYLGLFLYRSRELSPEVLSIYSNTSAKSQVQKLSSEGLILLIFQVQLVILLLGLLLLVSVQVMQVQFLPGISYRGPSVVSQAASIILDSLLGLALRAAFDVGNLDVKRLVSIGSRQLCVDVTIPLTVLRAVSASEVFWVRLTDTASQPSASCSGVSR
jgi:hypothetical protein